MLVSILGFVLQTQFQTQDWEPIFLPWIGVDPDQIYADGWAIGYDDRFPKNRRVQQAFLFARFSEHENLYAHPMVCTPLSHLITSWYWHNQDFIPVLDANALEVLHIDFPSQYKTSPDGSPVRSVPDTKPFPLTADPLKTSHRERIPPPLKSFDFLPDLMAQSEKNYKPRDDIKPLHVIQPEGVSFKMNGHELQWQNWSMHIGAFSFEAKHFIYLLFVR
jgi:primary-amine oxidase